MPFAMAFRQVLPLWTAPGGLGWKSCLGPVRSATHRDELGNSYFFNILYFHVSSQGQGHRINCQTAAGGLLLKRRPAQTTIAAMIDFTTNLHQTFATDTALSPPHGTRTLQNCLHLHFIPASAGSTDGPAWFRPIPSIDEALRNSPLTGAIIYIRTTELA